MKVIKNFLEKEEFKNIYNLLTDLNFPWYFQDGVNRKNDGHKQMCHIFVRESEINSHFIEVLNPLIKKLNIKNLIRLKSNLLFKTNKIIEHGFHVDLKDKICKTAVYYINTNNGYTKFENKKIIKSEENKIVIFKSDLKHTGSTCTDNDIRLVININYE
jgi:hypothetical protein